MTALLRAEMFICLGPTFAYLPTGVVMVPHQLRLAVGEGLTESWAPIAYYLGVACLLIGVITLWRWLRHRRSRMPRWATISLLGLGIGALALGPVGLFALGGLDDFNAVLIVMFLVLPLLSVLHLSFLARDYFFGISRQRT